MNAVSVISLIHQPIGKKSEKEIKNTGLKILKILKKNNVAVEIYLADAKKMRFLNKKFRNKDKVTNILSFEEPRNFILPPSKVRKIGEIYLKTPIPPPDFAWTKSRRAGNDQIPSLLVHGLLHLFGYTHQKKNDTITMEKKEKFLISNL